MRWCGPDRKPHEISDIADRLRTRFAWGLLADIGRMHEFRATTARGSTCCSSTTSRSSAGKESTQTEFFHTFNALHEAADVVDSAAWIPEREGMGAWGWHRPR